MALESPPDTPWTLGLALGAVSPAFRDQLQARLPSELASVHPQTQVTVPGETTDALWDLIHRTQTAPWDACFLTSELHGTRSLVETIYALHQKWPTMHLAIMVTRVTAEMRQLIAHCATYALYNIFVGPTITLPDLVTLLTVLSPRERVVPYLDPSTSIWLPPSGDAPDAEDGHDPGTPASPLAGWRSSSALRRLQWFRRTQEAPEPERTEPLDGPEERLPETSRPKPAKASPKPAPLWLRRRLWLVLGASGGVGTSTLVAALALRWSQHWGFTVGVLDAAPTGGYLNVALGAQIAETGWETGDALEVVAGTWGSGHWLVPHGTGPGSFARKTDVMPYVEALRRTPIDVWLVDGGMDMSLIGRGRSVWDGIIGVARVDRPGSYAATRWVPVWAEAAAFAGVVIMQHHAGALHRSDWHQHWHAPVLGVWPAADGLSLWRHQRLPVSWQDPCDALTPVLLGQAAGQAR